MHLPQWPMRAARAPEYRAQHYAQKPAPAPWKPLHLHSREGWPREQTTAMLRKNRRVIHLLIEPAGTATAPSAVGFLMFIALPLLYFMDLLCRHMEINEVGKVAFSICISWGNQRSELAYGDPGSSPHRAVAAPFGVSEGPGPVGPQ
jgi:hypothetical protein